MTAKLFRVALVIMSLLLAGGARFSRER